MKKNYYLNALGIVNALGDEKATIAQCFIRSVNGMVLSKNNATYVGQVQQELPDLGWNFNSYNSRNNQLIALAYSKIASVVESYKDKYGSNRIAVILGTSTSGIATGEQAFAQYQLNKTFPENFEYSQQEIGTTSEFLAAYAGVSGINYTISTACSSSGKAFATAARLLDADMCDVAIVGGSDALCQMTLQGFASLESISDSLCNPFSINRKGINIGEGAALFVMTKDEAEISLIGIGEASDGYHLTSPDPNGVGAKQAIQQALYKANCPPEAIGYINLHGTGTLKNDAMESHVIHTLFPSQPFCSSTKPLIGHTLGAAAAQELALCWLLLSEEYNPQRLLPPQLWDGCYDPNLLPINLIDQIRVWEQPYFMSNNFAFGGSNISLILQKHE